MELKELNESLQKAVADFRTVNDSLTKSEAEKKEILTKLNARIEELELKAKRTEAAPVNRIAGKEKSAEMKAWLRGICGARLSADELKLVRREAVIEPGEEKTLSLGDDTQAGYLAPKEFVNSIIKPVIPFSPIRQLATVRTTSSKSIMIPTRTAPLVASWVGQGGTKSEDTALKYGLEEIKTHKLIARKDVEEEMLQDSAFDLEAELSGEFSEQFGVSEGTAFVSGTGAGQPEGLLTNAAVLAAFTVSGNASALTGDGLINLAYALKSGYAPNASWVMRRATVGAVRQLKDPVTGRYLWEPALQVGQPSTLLGYPVYEAPDMPLSTSGGNYPVLFGDFRRAYTIVDRVSITVLRDIYSSSTSGIIRFIATKRVGGQVTLAEAVKVMKVSA
jgi:HK97 family phage major capsid protein